MLDKLKTIGATLFGLLLFPIILGGRIPHSIQEYLVIGLVGIIVLSLIMLWACLSDSSKRRNKSNYNKTKLTYQEITHISGTKNSIKNRNAYNVSTPFSRNNTAQNNIRKEVDIKTKDISNKQKVNQKEKENTITLNQRKALLKVAIDFCYCSPERLYLWKGQYEILLEFTKTLRLEERQLDASILEVSERFFRTSIDAKALDYYEVVKTIHQDEPFIQLINTCGKLLDFIDSLDDELIKTEYYAYLVFPEILKDIGFTQEEIEKIEREEEVYRFTDKEVKVEPLISTKEDFPVSKEQMAIFKENWTLSQFREKFGTEQKVISKTNHTRDEEYKICIFAKNSRETEVGFSNSLGNLTIDEIQKREKELMVGLSDYGNYKLYDNKIFVMTAIPIPLEIK